MERYLKIPEPFTKGDIVKLRKPELFRKDNDFLRHNLNLYRIVSIDGNSVKLANVTSPVPINELLPVEVNGKDDLWIYYDPIIMASFVFPVDPIPTHSTDYSYYMDAFEHCLDGKKTFKALLEKEHLFYVHEIQHFLRKKYNYDYLKINDGKH